MQADCTPPQSISSLDIWLSYLKKLHNKTIDMGLKRVGQVATRLNLLQPAPFIFTVAGTNGKGTTCKILEMILISAGYNVGVYTSPHLIRYTERVRIQNSELPESEHTASFSAIEVERKYVPLTYFEFSTLSALWLFKQKKLDIVILEVGLGGRLDATNIVDSDVAVITNIALDHTDWLGSERESIGREKAGIFRANKPAIVGELDIPKSIFQIAKEKNTKLFCYNLDWSFTINECGWNFKYAQQEFFNLPFPYIPQLNTATALAALCASNLKINEQAIRDGISNATLAGRFQIINQAPRLIFDVAHNPHAATYLAEWIQCLPNPGRILAVIGMLKDKDIAATIANMRNTVNYWYCASLQGPRGADSKYLMKYIEEKSEVYENVTEAWHAALSAAKAQDTILVFGSFYTVSHVMKIMEIDKNKF